MKSLSSIAETEPHAATQRLRIAYFFVVLCQVPPCGFNHWKTPFANYLSFERDLLSLPARLGGMGIMNPTELNDIVSINSIYISNLW